jgi:hypothetical protein
MLTISGHKRNANQNHTKVPPHLVEQLSVKTPSTAGVGEDVGKKEPLYTAGGNSSHCNHFGKQYGAFLKKLNVNLSYDLAISLLGIYL